MADRFSFGAQHRTKGKQIAMPLASPEERICRICNVKKSVSQFYWTGRFLKRTCKSCYNANRDITSQRRYLLKRHYGLTLEQYDAMLEAQEHRCAVCGVHKDEIADKGRGRGKNSKSLEVDHCHKAGHVRGLLCNSCNLALGRLNDNPAVAFKAFLYLQEWSEREK